MNDLRIRRGGSDRVDELEPLWTALHRQHARVAPSLGGLRVRSDSAAWDRRRRAYQSWLRAPDAFVLVAERGGDPVGYVLVRFGHGLHGWDSDERLPVLESLAVLPDARGAGVGTALLDAVEGELASRGARHFILGVIPQNSAAIRFYERRGLVPVNVQMLGTIGLGREAPDRPRLG